MKNNKRYVLREYFSLCPDGACQIDLLTEEEKRIKDSGATLLTGKISSADQKNGNGRTYPHSVLKREIDNYQKLIKEFRALGELDHPDGEGGEIINLKNVSHVLIRSWWSGNEVYGVFKLLGTPSGEIAKSLVKEGVPLGISSRALGSVTESKDGVIVNDDMSLICFDLVANPSAPGAFLHLQESQLPTSKLYTKADRIYRLLNEITRTK